MTPCGKKSELHHYPAGTSIDVATRICLFSVVIPTPGRYMNKLATLQLMVALEIGVCACGNPPKIITTTQANGNWEALLTGGRGNAAQLSFVTTFPVTPNEAGTAEPLDITGFGFFNSGACFATDQNGISTEQETGTATISTNTGTGQVNGPFTFTVSSLTPAGNTLTLSGNLTGTSNGTTTTTGTLSNGVVQGSWTLAGSSDCTGGGSFLMCQNANTCT